MKLHQTKIHTFWKPDGKKPDTANEAALKAWMRKNGLSIQPGALPLFIHSALHASTRQAAVKDLLTVKQKK